jgi:hypothetical protein
MYMNKLLQYLNVYEVNSARKLKKLLLCNMIVCNFVNFRIIADILIQVNVNMLHG